MKNILRVAGAYIGAIIGAGYASGQEVLQFFTSYGWQGTIGIVIAAVLYPALGYALIVLGQRLKAISYQTALYRICGRYLGVVVDILLIFFVFGVGVIMVAGTGSLVAQQFNAPPIVGYILMTVLVIAALTLHLTKIVTVMSWITPFAFALLLVISIYSMTKSNWDFELLDSVAQTQLKASPHWLLSTFLHASFNTVTAFGIMVMIGATEKDQRASRIGAIVGGIGLAVIALIVHLAVYANIDTLQNLDMPMLRLASEIHPAIGVLLSVALVGMIFSTALPCLYTVTARFVRPDTRNFKIASVFFGLAAFGLGFLGFTQLVNTLYPLQGYVGFALIGALIFYLVRNRGAQEEPQETSGDANQTSSVSGKNETGQ